MRTVKNLINLKCFQIAFDKHIILQERKFCIFHNQLDGKEIITIIEILLFSLPLSQNGNALLFKQASNTNTKAFPNISFCPYKSCKINERIICSNITGANK